tara:strand:+ start:313 stop:477 length:165 start_codon:yes stop_codon:yes gene_type:complete
MMVAVAQLVERRLVVPVVAGSIPVSHPIFPKLITVRLGFPGKEMGSINSLNLKN